MSSSSSSSSDEEIISVRRKVYRERVDHFNKWNERDFYDRFRFTKEFVVLILEKIKEQLILKSNR